MASRSVGLIPFILLAFNVIAAAATPLARAVETSEALQRLQIRAKDLHESAKSLSDLAIRVDTIPVVAQRTKLTMLKEDANKVCTIAVALNQDRRGMEAWQIALLDRVTPKCKALTEEISAALKLLSDRPGPLFAPTFSSVVGDILDRISGIARTTDEFISWSEQQKRSHK